MTDQLRNPSSSSTSSSSSSSSLVSSAPVLCVGGCGFWGSAKQESMCSKCFKAVVAKKEQQAIDHAAAADASSASSPSSSSPSSSSSSPSPSSVSADLSSDSSSLAIPALTHSRLSEELSPVVVADALVAEDATGGSSATSSVPSLPSPPPALSFSASLAIPLLSPQSSPQTSPLLSAPASSPLSTSDLSLSPLLSSPLSTLTLSPSPSTLTLPFAASRPKRKNRCTHCAVKVGLTYFSCRCNADAMFCVAHRYPHSHECPFDHRAQQQSNIAKNNPLCAHDKLERI